MVGSNLPLATPRRFIGNSSLRLYCSTLLATLAVALAQPVSADASIIVPQPQEFALASDGTGASDGGSSRSEPNRDINSNKLRLLTAFPADGGTSGSGTSAPSSGFGSGAGTTSALAGTVMSAAEHETVTGRVCREARLLIPAPPVDFLLRPPQSWI
jgi:hypothetical protein